MVLQNSILVLVGWACVTPVISNPTEYHRNSVSAVEHIPTTFRVQPKNDARDDLLIEKRFQQRYAVVWCPCPRRPLEVGFTKEVRSRSVAVHKVLNFQIRLVTGSRIRRR